MKEPRPSSRWLVPPRFDASGVQISSGIRADGMEVPDPEPLAPPVGYSPPTQLEDLIEQVIRRRDFVAAVEAQGAETFEEADDFEVEDDDYDPRFEETIYEKYFEAKSKRAAERAAQPAVAANQKVSVGLVSGSSVETTVETPRSASGVDKSSSAEVESASPSDPVKSGQ